MVCRKFTKLSLSYYSINDRRFRFWYYLFTRSDWLIHGISVEIAICKKKLQNIFESFFYFLRINHINETLRHLLRTKIVILNGPIASNLRIPIQQPILLNRDDPLRIPGLPKRKNGPSEHFQPNPHIELYFLRWFQLAHWTTEFIK